METMTESLAEDAIRVASLALPPPQRAAFCRSVSSHLASLRPQSRWATRHDPPGPAA